MAACKYCKAKNAELKVNLNRFCDFDCAVNYAKSAQERKKKSEARKRIAEDKKRDRETLERLKTPRQQSSDAQAVFNKLIRLQELVRFKELNQVPVCFSCQKPLGNDQWAAGHFYTRGARPDLAFEPFNVHLQHNVRCNMHLSGDIEGQKRGYAIRYGEKAQEILDSLAAVRPTPKRTSEEWKAIKAEWNREIRRLQKILNSSLV